MKSITACLPGRMNGMNPNGSNKRPLYHFVPASTTDGDMAAVAACGAYPKRTSYGWHPTDDVATCATCIKIVAQMQQLEKQGTSAKL